MDVVDLLLGLLLWHNVQVLGYYLGRLGWDHCLRLLVLIVLRIIIESSATLRCVVLGHFISSDVIISEGALIVLDFQETLLVVLIKASFKLIILPLL